MASPPRNKKGRFMKRSHASARRSSTSTALARRGPSSVASRPRPRAAAPVRRGGGRRRRSSSTKFAILGPVRRGGMVDRVKENVPGDLAAAAYAYITRGTDARAKQLKELLAKAPTFDQLGVPGSHSLLFTFIATQTDGIVSQIFDLLGEEAGRVLFRNWGASDFALDKAIKMSGDDGEDGVEMGGL